MVSYIKFVTGETVYTLEYQQDEVHYDNVINTKEHSIVISLFKTDIPLIMGGLVEFKESSTTLTIIKPPGL